MVAHAIKEGNLSLMCSGLVGDNMDPKTNVAPYRDLGFTQEEVREMLAQWADSIKTGAGKKLKRCVTMVNHAEVIIGKADQDVLNAASSSDHSASSAFTPCSFFPPVIKIGYASQNLSPGVIQQNTGLNWPQNKPSYFTTTTWIIPLTNPPETLRE